tara:strand:- start:39 stop:209 length:171 start_codon:yes stop_codon:yes gene_type:complete
VPGSTQIEFPANQGRGGSDGLAKFIAGKYLGLFSMGKDECGPGKISEINAIGGCNW